MNAESLVLVRQDRLRAASQILALALLVTAVLWASSVGSLAITSVAGHDDRLWAWAVVPTAQLDGACLVAGRVRRAHGAILAHRGVLPDRISRTDRTRSTNKATTLAGATMWLFS